MDSSKQAQRAVIQFLLAGVSGNKFTVEWRMCMGLSVCYVLRFSDGVVVFVIDVSTPDMPRPGQAHVVITQE